MFPAEMGSRSHLGTFSCEGGSRPHLGTLAGTRETRQMFIATGRLLQDVGYEGMGRMWYSRRLVRCGEFDLYTKHVLYAMMIASNGRADRECRVVCLMTLGLRMLETLKISNPGGGGRALGTLLSFG